MAVPVINSDQTVLAYTVGQDVFFQLAATNVPSGWKLQSGILPPGIVFNVNTGTISGRGVSPGVWNMAFSASNVSGESEAVSFVFAVFDMVGGKDVVKSVVVNTDTWAVTFPDAVAATPGGLGSAEGCVRYGDIVTFEIKFRDASGVYVPKLLMGKFSLKGLDTEPTFIVSREFDFRSAIVYEGDAYVRKFFIVVSFENPSLYSFLADYESDAGTAVNALCEFEFLFPRHPAAGFGGVDKITSAPFHLRVTRDSIL